MIETRLTEPLVLTSGRHELDCRPPIEGGAHVMGILNVTPDSFYDGGRWTDPDAALLQAQKMAAEGAVMIDVGGASSRPAGSTYGKGADLISTQEEINRVIPVVQLLAKHVRDVWISVDTFRSDVAQAAIAAGAHLVNDITALRYDENMAGLIAAHGIPVVLMHSIGSPGEMPHVTSTPHVVETVRRELGQAVEQAKAAGIKDIILDAGFGFGKTTRDNLALVAGTDSLVKLGYPVLVGISRKSSIGNALATGQTPPGPDDRLFGSLGATAVAVLRGASIVRTHDVKETVEFLRVFDATARSATK